MIAVPRLPAFVCFALLVALPSAAAERRVHALDIDRIGPQALEALRGDPRVTAFVELGPRALVEADAGFVAEQRRAGRWRASRLLGEGDVLAVHRRSHCDPLAEAAGVDAFGDHGRWHVEVRDAGALGAHEQRVGARDVLGWQAANRVLPTMPKDDDAALAALAARVDPARWRTQVQALASYDRQTGTGFNAALGVVAEGFAALGMVPQRQCFTASTPFMVDRRNCNLGAVQRGTSEDWVIVGAHLDARNATFDDAQPSPGAEDNASGCAGVLETARVLAGRRPRANILYQCYGLEERGLIGSRAHAATLDPARVRAMFNLDMIGYDGDGVLDVSIEATTPGHALLDVLAPLVARHTRLQAEFARDTCCSDHMSYLARGIPALMLIENDWHAYPQYHTRDDTPERLSDAMATEVVKLAVVAVAQVAGAADPVHDASGYWFDPARDGQGWQFEVQADGSVAATWYTFDAAGERLWLVASGTIDAAGGARLDAFVADGGRFPSASSPLATTTTQPWGELRFRFDDCRRGRVEWTPRSETGLPAGGADVERLTQPAEGTCLP